VRPVLSRHERTNTMRPITDKQFWEAEHRASRRQYNIEKPFENYRFGNGILRNFLTYDASLSLLEVGCVPGRNMVYFARNFGYQVSGLDYSDEIQKVGSILRAHNVSEFELFQRDFLEFNPSSKYDIVFSQGFVEHFTEPDLVFKKHVDLLRSNGLLIISLPNLHYGQKLLYLLFGLRHLFDLHNLDVMSPHIWSNLALKEGLSVLYCNYTTTFWFSLTPHYNAYIKQQTYRLCRAIEMGLRIFHLDQVPNRYFSPQILLVAKKQ
jgi:cyclopropane fatty-acyl-phospholipid synthase-like methyltransferase